VECHKNSRNFFICGDRDGGQGLVHGSQVLLAPVPWIKFFTV
jgi:hypothetical protein